MMDHAHYRRSLLADPLHSSAEMLAHAAICRDCAQYTARLVSFESRLDRALRVPVGEFHGPRAAPMAGDRPFGAAVRSTRARSFRSRGWAIAAGVLLCAVLAGALWLAAPGTSLAADIVGHMAEEPGAWARTDTPVPQPRLDKVLGDSHMHLDSGAALVSYANSCKFRGHVVPHLVVQTRDGPVTVMVLLHESTTRSTRFDEEGYHGMIVPVPQHGSLAVLQKGTAGDMKAVEGVAAQVLGAMRWTP